MILIICLYLLIIMYFYIIESCYQLFINIAWKYNLHCIFYFLILIFLYFLEFFFSYFDLKLRYKERNHSSEGCKHMCRFIYFYHFIFYFISSVYHQNCLYPINIFFKSNFRNVIIVIQNCFSYKLQIFKIYIRETK